MNPPIPATHKLPPKPVSASPNTVMCVGDVVGGKYRVDATLAEGGMGIVLLATHLDLDCPVALKVIRPEHLANEAVVERLLSEARIAASLRSKHVNRILDVGRTANGMPYLVLEYMAGSDLSSYLERRGRLPVSEAADYLLQVCEALAEAHAIGIVHRDLKPENVFLSEEADGAFAVKVLDFGISKAPPGRTGRGVATSPFEIMGSPSYMSPEQVRGSSVDARADIWALGALLHELCTGEVLFEAPSMARTFAKITDEGYLPQRYGTSSGALLLHQVVCRCLCRNPEDRYRDVVELARELAPLGSDSAQAARVAKVASASRARVIAGAVDESKDAAATPLAITKSELELAEGSGQARRLWRGLVMGVAACLPIIVSFTYLTHAAKPAASEVLAKAADEQAEPAVAPSSLVESSLVEAPLVEAPLVARPLLAQAPSPASSLSPLARAWHPPKALLPQAALRARASASSELKTSITAPAVSKVADAWDPKSFGGRR